VADSLILIQKFGNHSGKFSDVERKKRAAARFLVIRHGESVSPRRPDLLKIIGSRLIGKPRSWHEFSGISIDHAAPETLVSR
jgi:hypothetical protein